MPRKRLWVWRGVAGCLVLSAAQLALLRALPYSTSSLQSISSRETSAPPTPAFRLGSLRWEVGAYRREPRLAPLRDYSLEHGDGKTGVALAMALSHALDRQSPRGQAPREFLDARYEPVAALAAHQGGVPGHCVTRSGLLAAMLLAGGVPARVVQAIPDRGKGHNLVEVWDAAHGWVLVDPFYMGLVGNRAGPASAMAALRAPASVRWIGYGSSRTDRTKPRRFYEESDAYLFKGQLVYPEPWLYMRTGPRVAPWPYRGHFVHVGRQTWQLGLGQSWLRLTLPASLFGTVLCLYFAVRLRRESTMNPYPIPHVVPPGHAPVRDLLGLLRCPRCENPIALAATSAGGAASTNADLHLGCTGCEEVYPVIGGIPRMVVASLRNALGGRSRPTADPEQVATARSFGFEWSRFTEMYPEWERNFLEYMSPRDPDFFRGKRVLDVGCGNGRHAHFAARYGAEVWAVDLSDAVEVARANTRGSGSVNVLQADLHRLPFAPQSFDFIYCLGVLHHLPNPEAAFRNLVRFLKPGGEIQIYLYWQPVGQPVKRFLLDLVATLRKVTTRLPHAVLYPLAYPLAAAAYGGFVLPYRVMRAMPGTGALAERLPMKQYAAYPFRVCVNDQFDRFSAPIEQRYTSEEVAAWLERAGLEQCRVAPNWGWLGTGRKTGRTP